MSDAPFTPAVPPVPPAAPAGLSPAAIDAVKKTRPWVLFMAVLAIIGAAFLVIFGLIMTAASPALAGVPGFAGLRGVWILYIALAGVYVPMIVFMFRYTKAAALLVAGQDPAQLDAALLSQKSYWKYLGILTIVMIAVGIVGVILVTMFAVQAGLSGLESL